MQFPHHRRMMRTRVSRVERTTDNFVTVTVSGADLAHFEFLGNDQCVRVFFARPGQEHLTLPEYDGEGWFPQYKQMSDGVRPYVRNYTMRRFDPDTLELDIEFVAHGDEGPASAWATAACEVQELGL